MELMEQFPELQIRVHKFRNRGKVMSKKGKNQREFRQLKHQITEKHKSMKNTSSSSGGGGGAEEGAKGWEKMVRARHMERMGQLDLLMTNVKAMHQMLEDDTEMLLKRLPTEGAQNDSDTTTESLLAAVSR